MKIAGKEISIEKINFLFNLISLIAGIIFYVRVARSMEHKPTANHPLQDSVLVIDTRLQIQLSAIKEKQDSILKAISLNQVKLKEQNKATADLRVQLHQTIDSDWERLSKKEQEHYAAQLIHLLSQRGP